MEFAFHLPINGVSFGQVSMGFLREAHKRNLNPNIFPVNPQNIDLSTQAISDGFKSWIEERIGKSLETHKKSTPVFKLWHLNGSMESVSEKQLLFTFYELDQPTKSEINIAKNCSRVLVSSNYAKSVFENNGLDNVSFVPLYFDADNFNRKDKQYFADDRITFNLMGKLEKRKHHGKIIKAWAKRFGREKFANGEQKYFLQCAIFNNFLKAEDNNALIGQFLEGKSYFNINFLGYMAKNDLYNDFLNSGDIAICMSGGEGWGLPEFHSVAMGKHSVVLNAHSYKDWANESNSVLVSPNGTTEVYDGMFFHKGQPFNQGNIFDFDEDEFIDGCEKAIERVKEKKLNEEGLKLQEEFTLENTFDSIMSEIEKA